MTQAEELRAAAARMRELAEKATPGEWVAATGRGKLGVVGALGPDGPGSGVAVAVSATPGTAKAANAEHIAAWNPNVALAVAAWLESVADDESIGDMTEDYSCVCYTHALAVARAFMGGEQQ